MFKLFEKLNRFINRDVKNESETKDLAILIRVLCIFYFFYFLVFTPLLALMDSYFLALMILFAVGICLACFILTYEDKTKTAVSLLYLSILITTSILTIMVGWNHNFQWNYMILVLLSYFSLDENTFSKKKSITLIFTVTIIVALISLLFPRLRQPSDFVRIVEQVFSTCFYLVIMAVIAYLYSIKFNQSEEKLRQTNDKLLKMASVDSLTKLPNRRSMNDHLATLTYEYERNGKEFSIAIGDVDHFKMVNDDFGHETGDFILNSLASIFQESMKESGFAARWGGEEFLFTFEGMSLQQAFAKLEGLRIRIENTPFVYNGNTVHISMTFGLEEYSSIFSVESTISKADTKLYQGKESGRNRVVY